MAASGRFVIDGVVDKSLRAIIDTFNRVVRKLQFLNNFR